VVLGATKKAAVKLTAISTVSTILLTIVKIPVNVLLAYLFGPALLGMLKVFDLITKYSSFTHFGLMNSLVRQVPIALGRKDEKESHLIEDVVFSANLVAILLSIMVLWILYLSGIDFKGIMTPFRLAVISLTIILNRIMSYLHSYLKAYGEFEIITKRQVVIAWISPFLLISCVYLYKLDGALFVYMLLALISIFFYAWGAKIRIPRLAMHFKKLCELLSIGFKLFGNRILDSIFWTVDTTIIAILLMPRDVGLYGFVLGIVAATIALSDTFNMMIYRHMLENKGKSGGDKQLQDLKKYLEIPFSGFLAANTIAVVTIYFACIIIIKIFLTKYIDALACLPILALGQIFFQFSMIPSLCMNVLDQLEKRLAITAGALLLNASLDVILIKMGYGIVGAAWASTISFTLYAIVLTLIVRVHVYGNYHEPILFIGKCTFVILYTFLSLYVFSKIEIIDSSERDPIWIKLMIDSIDAGLKIGIVSTFSLVGYFTFFRKQELLREFFSAAKYLFSGISIHVDKS